MANGQHVDLLRAQASALAQWKLDNRKARFQFAYRYYPGMPNVDAEVERVFKWNLWRVENRDVVPDLSGAWLHGLDLSEADFNGANLKAASLVGANLSDSYFIEANLSEADLERAQFREGSFRGANFSGARFGERLLEGNTFGGAHLAKMDFAGANFTRAYLFAADFYGAELADANFEGSTLTHANFSTANVCNADFSGAGMSGTNFAWADARGAKFCGALMRGASLVEAKLQNADLSGARVYGISAWDVEVEGTNQSNLVITRDGKSTITVDNLEVAQFIYLLLNNKKIRDVIETIGKKAVLILGNFKPERKRVLDSLREALRARGYLPILFDFDVPTNRDITETVSALAHLSRFIIADITDARSIPQELQAIVPNLPSVPVKPLLLASQGEYGMFEHFKRYPQVLETELYEDEDKLLASLATTVIEPAERKAEELKPA
jgi:uncharacterized protein YjbI with pentapeptide repeats